MNLIQIQDRLKGMPMQAIMAYANGQNPEVPPYLALGELNRRKQMEKQDAQAPKGSVKDEIEQSLMARNSAQQGILGVPHPSMQQVQPQTQMPSGAPTAQAPEMPTAEGEQYAMGGVVALPVRNEMFNYASGGIIAFSGKDDDQQVKEEKTSTAGNFFKKIGDYISEQQQKNLATQQGVRDKNAIAKEIENVKPGLFEKLTPTERAARENELDWLQKYAQDQRNNPSINLNPSATPVTSVAPVQTAPVVTPVANTGTNVAPPAGSPVVRPPPTGIASNPAGNAAAQFLANAFKQTPAVIPEYKPPVQTPIGQKMEQYLTEQQQEDLAAQQKFKDVEQQRAKSALWRNLIAAGEATRGGGGIGALLGGYGKSALAEEEAALGRESEQDKLVRERKFNNVKMTAELENLRRAEERNDAKAIYDSKVKIHELERQDQDLKQRAAERVYAETESNKRANLQHAGSPSEIRFIEDWMKNNPGKTYSDAYAAYKRAGAGTATERQDLAELRVLQKTYMDQSNIANNSDKASREDASRRLAIVNKKIEEMSGINTQAPKVMSKADVAATAKASGKTEQQVIEQAQSQGYTIK